MKHIPTGTDYRNAAGALLIAFRMLFADELAARRSFRAALDRLGSKRTLLLLRTAPAEFGPVLSHVEARTVELVDEAARAFAACRSARTRRFLRDSANILRRGYVLDLAVKERAEAERALADAKARLTKLEERRKRVAFARKRLEALVPDIFKDPVDEVVQRIIAFGDRYGVHNRDGGPDLWGIGYSEPERFGRLRRKYLKGWKDSCKELIVLLDYFMWFGPVWPRRYTTFEADQTMVSFRSDAMYLVQAIQNDPSDGDLQAARERVEAATAALAAFGPEKEEDRDTYRACRQAAPILLDAMQRLERFPSDAAPQIKRQLARLLPSGADFLISYAVRLACKHAEEDRRQGGARGGRSRDLWR